MGKTADQPRDKGKFSFKPGADAPAAGEGMRLQMSEASEAEYALGSLSARIAVEESRIGHPSTTLPVLAGSWAALNSMAAVAARVRDSAAAEFLGQTVYPDKDDDGEPGAPPFVGRWVAMKVRRDEEDPEMAGKARYRFLEETAKMDDCEQVENLSRAMWADSAWSAAGLESVGVEPRLVSDWGRRDARVVADETSMAGLSEKHGPEIEAAFGCGPVGRRMEAAAECCLELSELRDRYAEEIIGSLGNHEERPVVDSDGAVVGAVRPVEDRYTNYRCDAVFRELRHAAAGDPRKLAEMHAAARRYNSSEGDIRDDGFYGDPPAAVRRVAVRRLPQHLMDALADPASLAAISERYAGVDVGLWAEPPPAGGWRGLPEHAT